MKTPTTSLILTIATLALQTKAASPTTKCNADNCARAVTGTAKGAATLAAHMEDCSSFQWATFTPDTFYETVTVPFPQTIAPRHNRRRQNNPRGGLGGRGGGAMGSISYPTLVPAYASACSGTVRYASACSCAGITGGTRTVEAVTVTVTETEAAVTS